jgi:5-methylcytosine-specific restriction endonuclease McrA
MASLSTFINKLGKRAGRKAYNAYHQEYRNTHRRRIRAYNIEYKRKRGAGLPTKSTHGRAARKARNTQKHRLYVKARYAKQKGVGGSYTLQQWHALLKQYDYRCAICRKRKPLTADHIVPVSLWRTFYRPWIEDGTMTYQCNDIENIQPLCALCNSIKSNKLMGDGDFVAFREDL